MRLRLEYGRSDGFGAKSRVRRRSAQTAAIVATVMGVFALTVGSAFANAANPNNDSQGSGVISGTVATNADGSIKVLTGSVVVKVNGTWNWVSQTGCAQRFGVGWAVDWYGVSPTAIPNTFGWPIKNTNLLFHVDTVMDGVSPFTTCNLDAGGHPIG